MQAKPSIKNADEMIRVSCREDRGSYTRWYCLAGDPVRLETLAMASAR